MRPRGALQVASRALAQAAGDPVLAAKLRELAAQDLEQIWRSVVAIARFGEHEDNRLIAAELLLAYAVGRPAQTVNQNVTQTGQRAPSLPPLDQLSTDELEAIRTLMAATRRRALILDGE